MTPWGWLGQWRSRGGSNDRSKATLDCRLGLPKLMNFRRFDPVYQAQGKTGLTRGNKLEEAVWNDFASDPPRLNTIAYAVEANLNEQASLSDIDEVKEIVEAEEGRILTRAHLIRERSRKLVQRPYAGALPDEFTGFFQRIIPIDRRGRGRLLRRSEPQAWCLAAAPQPWPQRGRRRTMRARCT
jgi:hypothetical protein